MSSYYLNPSLTKRNDRRNQNGKTSTNIPTVAKRVSRLKEGNLSALVNGKSTLKKPKAVLLQRDRTESSSIKPPEDQIHHTANRTNKQFKEKQIEPIELQVAIQVPFEINADQVTSKDGVDFSVQDNLIRVSESVLGSHEFTFDSILCARSDEEGVKAQIGYLLDGIYKYESTAAFFISQSQCFFKQRPSALKEILENIFPVEQSNAHVQIYFSYCLAIDGELYDLLDENSKVILNENGNLHYTQRKTFSIEHVLDLIQLGNLKQALNQTNLDKKNYTYIYQLALKENERKSFKECIKYVFLVDLNINCSQGSSFDSHKDVQAIETCIRERQRRKCSIPAEANIVTHFLKLPFASAKSKMLFFYVLSTDVAISKRSLLMLNFLQRIEIYGTEEDNYADSIIQKNQALIESLKASEEMSIYLFLINNVSILEQDLLNAHQHFNEITTNWSEHHRRLQSMSVEDRMYDVDKYTSQLLNLLTEQWTQIGNLIDSTKKFQTGLLQLKQSVNAIDNTEHNI